MAHCAYPLYVTFSIVAHDPRDDAVGVAVASKHLAVGGIVPAADRTGAVATQAYTNAAFRQEGLDLLRVGYAPREAVMSLLSSDLEPQKRQVGIVDASGRSYSVTGTACSSYAASAHGPGYAIQGNLLTGPEVVEAMLSAWTATEGTDLESRLLAVLAAGDRAGGDARGRQSAALLIARAETDYILGTDIDTDLRADDHPDPIAELRRLLAIRKL